jgi:hypothetical protein
LGKIWLKTCKFSQVLSKRRSGLETIHCVIETGNNTAWKSENAICGVLQEGPGKVGCI